MKSGQIAHNHLVASLPSLPGFGFPLFFSTDFSLLKSSFSLAVAGYSRPSFSGRFDAVSGIRSASG